MTLPPSNGLLGRSFGFDLETWGKKQEYALQPFRAQHGLAGIKSAAVATIISAAGHLYPSVETVRKMLLLAINRGYYVVGWNVVFDAAWCIAVGLESEVFAAKWLDAMLLWRHAVVEPEGEDVPKARRKKYSLEAAMHEFYPDEAGFKEFNDFQATDEASLQLLLHRNKEDARWTLILADKFWTMLNAKQQTAALIEARCIPLMAKTRVMGIAASESAARELYDNLSDEYTALYAELLSKAPEIEGINLGSSQQLQALLYDTWGLPADRFSKKTSKPSTDKYALFDLAALDPRAQMLKKIREAKNNRKKYAEGTLNSLKYNGDGFVRPQAKVFSTYCVPGDVEVLTREGWARLDQWEGGEIVQAYSDGNLEFLPADRFVGPVVDEWIRVDHKGLKSDFTEGHTIPYLKQKTREWATTHAGIIFQKHRSQFDIPVAGNLRGLSGCIKPLQMQILCMAQADGWFSEEGFLKFTFKKQRKVERCKRLLNEGGISCRVRVWPSYPDRTEIIISKKALPEWLNPGCKILGDWLLDTTFEGLKAFVDELVHWDGSHHSDGGIDYSSFVQGNLEWVVTLAHLVGRKAAVHKHNTAHISECSPIHAIRAYKHCLKVTKSERAYCATTVTGFWLARSKGTIFITGNTSRMTYGSSESATVEVEKTTKKNGTQIIQKKTDVPSGIALHQWKRGKNYRRIIMAPPGYLLCEFDFAGQEFRWMAVESGDETMLSLCAPGEDPHSYMGAQIAQRDYRELIKAVKSGVDPEAELQRKCGKFSNLSYQYRVSGRTATTKARVEYELDVDEIFIKQTQHIYRTSYVRVGGLPHERNGGYWGRQIQKCKRLGYAETLAGRRVQLTGNWAGRDSWAMESTAINFPIQGVGGDQKYLALAVARNLLPEFCGYVYMELHDGLFFIFPEAKAVKAAEVFLKELSNLPYKQAWGVTLPIQFPVDAKIGPSWGDLVDLAKWKN